MRCNWQRWLWGLIPLMMVTWVAIQVERDRIRQDLTARASEALAQSDSQWASVEINGRDVVLRGRAIQDSQPPRAEKTVRTVWGVRDVENRAILPPKVEPFTWNARRRGNRIRLTGYVPDRPTRQAVIGLTKAAMPGLEVVDRMNTARGVPSPDIWLSGLSFALKQLSSLKNGDARFEDLSLTISGEAEDPAAFKAVSTSIRTGIPKGIKVASAQIAAPVISPFTWSAQFAAGQLVLGGHVAGGDKARADLMAAAKAAAPGINPVDRMELAEGAPQGWTAAVAAAMKQLVRLENGAAETKDAALTISGLAADEAQAQTVRTELRASVPSAFTIVDHVRVRPPKAPEAAPPAPQHRHQGETGEKESFTTATAAPAPQPSAEPLTQQTPPPADASPKQAAPVRQTDSAPPKQETAAPQLPVVPDSKQAAPAPPSPPSKQAAAPAPPTANAPSTPEAPAAKQPEPPQAPPPEPAAKTAAAPPPAAPSLPAPSAPAALSPEANACQDTLRKIAGTGHINFASDSATLDSTSFETLDRLAAAARACPGIRIAIEGHTDAEGGAGYNQRLSVRRAQAVASYLVKAGADRKQLEAVGYGFTRPAAPNDTEENMARNRRIEFSVRQQ